jgi:hypothetical protein
MYSIKCLNIPEDFYRTYLQKFNVEFSSMSTAIEGANQELEEAKKKLQDFKKINGHAYYDQMIRDGKYEEDDQIDSLKDQITELFDLSSKLIPKFHHKMMDMLGIRNDTEDESYIRFVMLCPKLKQFTDYLPIVIRPCLEYKDFVKALEDGETKEDLYNKSSDQLLWELYRLILDVNIKEKEKEKIIKANYDAFDYALSCDNISHKEQITMDSIVTQGAYNSYKSSDNCILKSSLQEETRSKNQVYEDMNQLFYDYEKVWQQDIDKVTRKDNDYTEEEFDEYIRAVCLREAKFHIRFEHIHPFGDGNGRVGRIIMNRNLIKAGLPPLILPASVNNKTDTIQSKYITYVSERKVEELAELIYLQVTTQIPQVLIAYQIFQEFKNSKKEPGFSFGENSEKTDRLITTVNLKRD